MFIVIKIQSFVRSLFFALPCLLVLPAINAQVEEFVSVREVHGGLFVRTLYGDFVLDAKRDKALIEFINSEAFQRLNGIYQYGPIHHVNPDAVYSRYPADERKHARYTRFAHSISTAMLARRMNRPITEQIAAVGHDLSHCLESHVADIVLGANEPAAEAYQDTVLEQFFEDHGTADILRKNRISVKDVLKKPSFLDRLDYTLTGCWLVGLLEQEHINQIVNDLAYNKRNHFWYFKTIESALLVANCALDFAEINHGAPWNTVVLSLAAQAIKRAFDLGLFTEDDFKYNPDFNDDDLWSLLTGSNDRIIRRYMNKITNHQSFFDQEDEGSESDASSIIIAPKFRGLDPLVQIRTGKYHPLTDLDGTFRARYYQAEANTKIGARAYRMRGMVRVMGRQSRVLYGV